MSDTGWQLDKELVEALCEIDSGLSDWELDFINSLAQDFAEYGQGMSVGQRQKAEEILKRFEG